MKDDKSIFTKKLEAIIIEAKDIDSIYKELKAQGIKNETIISDHGHLIIDLYCNLIIETDSGIKLVQLYN